MTPEEIRTAILAAADDSDPSWEVRRFDQSDLEPARVEVFDEDGNKVRGYRVFGLNTLIPEELCWPRMFEGAVIRLRWDEETGTYQEIRETE